MPGPARMERWRRGHMGGAKLASWPWRLASGSVDYIPLLILFSIFDAAAGVAVGFVITLIPWAINSVYLEGTTGQSLGKRLVGTRVVSAVPSGPTTFTFVYPGIGRSFGRQLAHFVDFLVFYTGFIRPLWQYMHRTWADTIAKTVVLDRSYANVHIEHRAPGTPTAQGL